MSDRMSIPATLDGPFEMSGYDHLELAQNHLAELPDGTTVPLPPGTKLHRIGCSGPLLTMKTGEVRSTEGQSPTVGIDA